MELLSPKLDFDPTRFAGGFNREPFGYGHDLHTLDMFKSDALRSLAACYTGHPRDFFVATRTSGPGEPFRSVPERKDTPVEALERIERDSCRLLLRRPEDHDPRFRELLDALFDQIVNKRAGALVRSDVVQFEAAILITSASTTTPFHLDPEIGFFSQVEGEKEYHVYPPAVLSEPELENVYCRNVVGIGQLALEERDAWGEDVFHLRSGMGLHQPQNAPHWVQTGAARSVSYRIVLETEQTRARGRTRAFNYYERLIGLRPAIPGRWPTLDIAKAHAMHLAHPVRGFLGRRMHAVLSR